MCIWYETWCKGNDVYNVLLSIIHQFHQKYKNKSLEYMDTEEEKCPNPEFIFFLTV
jgi:hypothetical protein